MDNLGHVISHWGPASKYDGTEANNLTAKIDVIDIRSPHKVYKNT